MQNNVIDPIQYISTTGEEDKLINENILPKY